MYTSTHGIAGWVLGRRLQKDENDYVPLACFCGSVVSDLPLIGQIFWNWSHGHQGEAVISTVSERFTEIAHSIPVWLMFGTMSLVICHLTRRRREIWRLLWAFLIGVLIIHIGVDMLTHRDASPANADYLWPWHFRLAPVLGIWTYRSVLNTYMPKWQELVIDAALIFLAARRELPRFFAKKGSGTEAIITTTGRT